MINQQGGFNDNRRRESREGPHHIDRNGLFEEYNLDKKWIQIFGDDPVIVRVILKGNKTPRWIDL